MWPILGVCVNSAGLTCHPKKKPKIVSHEVVLYNANGSQVSFQGKILVSSNSVPTVH